MNNAIGPWSPLSQSLSSQSRQSLDGGPATRSGNSNVEGRSHGVGQNRALEGAEGAKPTGGSNFDVDGLVANLWGFMQSRLAEAQAAGASESEMENMWQAAEKGLKQGFGQAREALDAMNKMNGDLESKIDAAYQGLSDILDARDLSANAPVSGQAAGNSLASDSRSISLYQYREQTFGLDLRTSEGDRIQIQVARTDEAGAEFQRNQGGETLSWGRAGTRDFTLQIQGDLSDTERADLDRLLGQVNDLANEFYDGDMAVAWEKAQALSIDGTSLASMDLRMRDVEAKGVAAYQSAGGEQRLPRGLEALRDYAREMVAAQQQWIDRFDSRDALPEALRNNPLNDGRLEAFTRSLLGG